MNPLLLLALVLAATKAFQYVRKALSTEPEPDLEMPGMAAAKSEQCKLAVHEAGHAVAAWCCTSVVSIESISVELETGGGVEYTFTQIDTAHTYWCQLVIGLAGIAAEVYTYENFRSGPAKKDLNKARALAKKLVALGSPPPPWGEHKHSKDLPFERFWESPPTVAERAILNKAYKMARDIAKAHGRKFFMLVSLILTKPTLSESDAAQVLGSRVLMGKGLLGAIRPTFLLPNWAGFRKVA